MSSLFNFLELSSNCLITFGIISSKAFCTSLYSKSFKLFTNAVANTVAVVVPSPASLTVCSAACLISCAPIFLYGFLNLIAFATETPSLVTIYLPCSLSLGIITVEPFGPVYLCYFSWCTS